MNAALHDAHTPTLLIVDDERTNRMLLADLLQDQGRIILAKDGPSALERVRTDNISLILLDASMPGMDGYEVLRILKSDEQTANIAVIFITGQTDEEDEERGLLLGAVDYIGKPIRPLLVRARVSNHLRFAQQREQLEQLSLRDGLTGIANRRAFDQAFSRACAHALRTGMPFGLVFLDVDFFKHYNDRYGHAAGDDTLRQIAGLLSTAASRPFDLAARYGGEEFALLLSSPDDIAPVVARMQTALAALGIAHDASAASSCVTVSCGAVVGTAAHASWPQQLLARCDQALYAAKRGGRNQLVFHPPD